LLAWAQNGRTDLEGTTMTNRRAKIAATATVLGLGALGGVALESNHGVPATTQSVAAAGGSVVTSASGAVSPAGQPVALRSSTARKPIVTRASGSGSGGARFDD
jgi:hypothetical protein